MRKKIQEKMRADFLKPYRHYFHSVKVFHKPFIATNKIYREKHCAKWSLWIKMNATQHNITSSHCLLIILYFLIFSYLSDTSVSIMIYFSLGSVARHLTTKPWGYLCCPDMHWPNSLKHAWPNRLSIPVLHCHISITVLSHNNYCYLSPLVFIILYLKIVALIF